MCYQIAKYSIFHLWLRWEGGDEMFENKTGHVVFELNNPY